MEKIKIDPEKVIKVEPKLISEDFGENEIKATAVTIFKYWKPIVGYDESFNASGGTCYPYWKRPETFWERNKIRLEVVWFFVCIFLIIFILAVQIYYND